MDHTKATSPNPAASGLARLSDAGEIARFDRLAAEWWNPEGPMKPLHRLNPTRIAFLHAAFAGHFGRDSRALAPFAGLDALDLGCGAGLVAEPLARMGFAVTGLDLAPASIAAARQHAEAGGLSIRYEARAVQDLPAEPAFDAITMLEIVEHVPDWPALIREAALRLRPGGMLVASTLNRTLKAYALAIIGAEYVLGWLPRGTHDWERFVTPDELDDAFRAAGLAPRERRGMVFSPLAGEWRLAADCDVNYLASATKPAA
ncbi:bifunctional 2-polyprenyl-6-hydroxyphenol methylase/3-demethylubiquinol 3-O-methyltransferase UbiG [Rhabdaerophilum calidifontis]|uniref:bifunctional 2-polyprenyl-6-hydroxyphenol methylase/3-demethylubiquinol 3-O-methyltransferase UbiG n=1 Tax=Rhabdaerophilum calidifontis TaxID=2604328 RepID=UPI001238980B|nr:bifunctional 2-polyprenyl-6-hydroxyphenol methylase/3-demethylubiquinol 3-O-methyltransferase UbiG [Rhabdaerophilum calidifontis]